MGKYSTVLLYRNFFIFYQTNATFSILYFDIQSCRMHGNKCQYPQCDETKRLLLHVKTCAAGPDFNCPTGYHGCNQARKLLSHYRRCRELRQRQKNSKSRKGQPYSCLVCSLMARQAMGSLKRSSIKNNSSDESKSSIALEDKSIHIQQHAVQVQASSCDATNFESKESSDEDVHQNQMPPPPPRARTNSVGNGFSSYGSISKKNSNRILPVPQSMDYSSSPSNGPAVFGSPPTTPQLMKRGVSNLAATAAPLPFVNRSCRTIENHIDQEITGEKLRFRPTYCNVDGDHNNLSSRKGKYRAESYDERDSRRNSIKEESSLSTSISSPELLGSSIDESMEYSQEISNDEESTLDTKEVCSSRLRSVSCSVLSSISMTPGGCETIMEEDYSSNGTANPNHHIENKIRSCSLNFDER